MAFVQPCGLPLRPLSRSSTLSRHLLRHPRVYGTGTATRSRLPVTPCMLDEMVKPCEFNASSLIMDKSGEHSDLPGVHFVSPPPLSGADLLAIVLGDSPDALVNDVLRAILGWRCLNAEDGQWDDSNVPPEWRNSYPKGPPDFIGDPNNYSPAIDMPVKLAMQKLTRSIPPPHKQGFKGVMRPLGFSGWKIKDLNPNRTRRATAVNYIIYWYCVHYPDYSWD